MSRWKPPKAKSSPYISPEGFQHLKNEYDEIWKLRADVTKALSAAAAEGDRSENAEYIYRKKELGRLDSRIRYLQVRLQELIVVNAVADQQHIFFGAKVSIKESDGNIVTIKIVGSDELNSDENFISVDSPLARAMLGKSLGDDASYQAGEEKKVCQIVDIKY
jgi:transcription elongation factor GreB